MSEYERYLVFLDMERNGVLGRNFVVYGSIENPLFKAKDVSEWIDLTNVTDMISKVDSDEVTKLNLGGLQGECNFLTEDGLYEVLMQSRKPIAKSFKREVKTILKSIRKNGIYATDVTIEKMLNDPDFAISLLTKLKEEKIARIEAERKNAILMHVNKTYTMTEIAKELNMKSATILNRILSDKKIQYQSNGTWVMYSKYSDLGYENIKQEVLDNGKVVYHRRITQLGRDFILRILQK